LSNFNAISYVGRLWSPELIPDINKFLPVAIFKMAATIPHLHLLLMSFPSLDVTSIGLDHGQRCGFGTFDWPFSSLWPNIRLLP
jgi:hypothetical protein